MHVVPQKGVHRGVIAPMADLLSGYLIDHEEVLQRLPILLTYVASVSEAAAGLHRKDRRTYSWKNQINFLLV